MKKGLQVALFALVCTAVMLAGVPANANEKAFKGKIGNSLADSKEWR